ncbi:MAG TPA: DUF1501 domain-containing protein [Lacunisphaera sp.]|nr:DUF1501 domain-containing protein [Lacunisphaera sp.]
MKNPAHGFPATRREFLKYGAKGAGLLAFSRFAPAFLVESAHAQAPAPEKDRTILVLVQLAGGNDGLNTVVPFADPNYRRLRPTLGLPEGQLLKINDTLAFNSGCAAMHELLKDGKLGIVQNVGYPNPNRSHFRSTEIWETASESNQFLPTGWLGRFFDNACAGAPTGGDPCGVNISNEVPQSFQSEHQHPTFSIAVNARYNRRQQSENLALLEQLVQAPAGHDDQDNAGYLRHTMMDALVTEKKFQQVLGDYQTGIAYPGTPFANSLRNVAALIAGGTATRVYYVSLTGFDTHNNQAGTHTNLLKTLAEGLAAFQKDLEAKRLDGQVLTMTFSEFGRRPSENESRGTDHGTAAPLFVLGSHLKPGLHGSAPSLQLERNQDMAHSTDFRQVYSTLLDKWLGCKSTAILGKNYQPLGFI